MPGAFSLPDAAQSGKAWFFSGGDSPKDKTKMGQSVHTAQSIWLGLQCGCSCETRLRDENRQAPSAVLAKVIVGFPNSIRRESSANFVRFLRKRLHEAERMSWEGR